MKTIPQNITRDGINYDVETNDILFASHFFLSYTIIQHTR